MKKTTILTALIVLFLGPLVQAQSMVPYTWDSFNTKFKIGSGMTVDVSNEEKFEASSTNCTLDLYPQKVANLTRSQMKTDLKAWTESNGVTPDSDGYKGVEDLNGYWGEQCWGTKGDWAVCLMYLHDPNRKDLAMYVWVSFNSKSVDLAVDIITSFEPQK